MTSLLLYPNRTRLAAPRRAAAAARIGHTAHERRVADVSLKLFDLLSGRHGLDEKYRELLATAALVHDTAKEASPADHDVRGAEMVLADRTLPLTQPQRRAVAFLVRYHRDGDGAAEAARAVHGYDARALMTLLAILHAGDGLDSRRVPVSAMIIRRKGRALDVSCLVTGKLVKARRALTRPRKFKLLDRVLGIDVRVRVERALDDAPTG